MSFKSLLAHRCTILRQDVDLDSGSPVYNWTPVKENVRCFIDLNFIRNGKDPIWTPEAGRSSDRTGVAFFLRTAPLMNGDWIKVTVGPVGVFSFEMSIDEARKPKKLHHYEISVREIPKQLAAGAIGAPGVPGDPIPTPKVELLKVPLPLEQYGPVPGDPS